MAWWFPGRQGGTGRVTSLQALHSQGWHLKAWLRFRLRLWSLTWCFGGNAQTSSRYVLRTVSTWQVTMAGPARPLAAGDIGGARPSVAMSEVTEGDGEEARRGEATCPSPARERLPVWACDGGGLPATLLPSVHAASCTCTLTLQPSPSCSPGTEIRDCQVLSSGGSYGFFCARLWWERGQDGASGRWLRLDLRFPGRPQAPPSLIFSLLLPPPYSSLPSKASFSLFQKISDGLSEAWAAGACNWWGSLLHTHTLSLFLSVSLFSRRMSRNQGQFTPDTRGSLSGPTQESSRQSDGVLLYSGKWKAWGWRDAHFAGHRRDSSVLGPRGQPPSGPQSPHHNGRLI